MFIDGHETKVTENPLNDNFAKKKSQALWNEINHKYAYAVNFDSNEMSASNVRYHDVDIYQSLLDVMKTMS